MTTDYTEKEVVALLGRQVAVYGNQRTLAKRIGISSQYLNDILKQKRGLSHKVLSFLGIYKQIRYIQHPQS